MNQLPYPHDYEPGPSGDDECWKMYDEFGTMCGLRRSMHPPMPEPIYKLVQADIAARAETWQSRYGKYLTVNTPVDLLQMLYEELLDGANYIRAEIERRKQAAK